jgi:hypothetical protein
MISAFIKAIENKRNIIQKQILEPILQLLVSKKARINGEFITNNIFWEDVIPRNSQEIANELKVAREIGIISQYNAVKSYM